MRTFHCLVSSGAEETALLHIVAQFLVDYVTSPRSNGVSGPIVESTATIMCVLFPTDVGEVAFIAVQNRGYSVGPLVAEHNQECCGMLGNYT